MGHLAGMKTEKAGGKSEPRSTHSELMAAERPQPVSGAGWGTMGTRRWPAFANTGRRTRSSLGRIVRLEEPWRELEINDIARSDHAFIPNLHVDDKYTLKRHMHKGDHSIDARKTIPPS